MNRLDQADFKAGDLRQSFGGAEYVAKNYQLTIRNGSGVTRQDTLVALNFHDFTANLDYTSLAKDDIITNVTLLAA